MAIDGLKVFALDGVVLRVFGGVGGGKVHGMLHPIAVACFQCHADLRFVIDVMVWVHACVKKMLEFRKVFSANVN